MTQPAFKAQITVLANLEIQDLNPRFARSVSTELKRSHDVKKKLRYLSPPPPAPASLLSKHRTRTSFCFLSCKALKRANTLKAFPIVSTPPDRLKDVTSIELQRRVAEDARASKSMWSPKLAYASNAKRFSQSGWQRAFQFKPSPLSLLQLTMANLEARTSKVAGTSTRLGDGGCGIPSR